MLKTEEVCTEMPTARAGIREWNRYYSQNEPTISQALKFYSEHPFNGYKNIIQNIERKKHFDNLKKRLDVEKYAKMIAHEYFTFGDAFPFVSIKCSDCDGTGVLSNENICEHEDGEIGNITVLNPDWVDVKINPLKAAESFISLITDETLKQIVFSKNPPEIYDAIPDHLKELIKSDKKITLNNKNICHLKNDEIPYMAYGRSLISPLFPTLSYREKLQQAENSENSTNLTEEYNIIEQRIIRGLGVNSYILSGEGDPSEIGDVAIKRLFDIQNKISKWILEYIYKPEAKMKGFYKIDLNGDEVLDYPDVEWNDMD